MRILIIINLSTIKNTMGYWKYLTAKGLKTLFYSTVAYVGPSVALTTFGPAAFIAVNTFVYMGGIEFFLMLI
jgi:hypothetical protein